MLRTFLSSAVLAVAIGVSSHSHAQQISKPECGIDEEAFGWCDVIYFLPACTVDLWVADCQASGRCGGAPAGNGYFASCEETPEGSGYCCRTCVPIVDHNIARLAPEGEQPYTAGRRNQCAQLLSDSLAGVPSGPPNRGCIQGDPTCEPGQYSGEPTVCENINGKRKEPGIGGRCD